MDRTRSKAAWWLAGCLVVTAVLLAMTANRAYNAVQLEQSGGPDMMSWDLITQGMQSLLLAAAVACAGLLPAAWIGLRGHAVVHVVHAPQTHADVRA
jgi:hypothetical protein